ncbi:hypothetical protein ADL00_17300 [Streptomyces sp. AS58]|uniref:hypothetical protein n=1 Tax=Streptomyces sp. AS58 TaxID=1519489 RepID=UPI0006AD9574|nr:hypothetical protein [Streptomyces sp. AS58]KOV66573.1 hypothetical protein ADL00_17300 [Streptomyces sp. AS58]
MAAVSLETTELETLVESAINNKRSGFALLNALRVRNGKPPHPANYGPGELNNVHASDWQTALASVQTALDTEPDAADAMSEKAAQLA